MAERYNKLFALPPNLYIPGAPVVISAGALLKDNQSGRVLAQLKFKSLSELNINALKVQIVGYDVSGAEVCCEEHHYLDMNVSRGQSFGNKEAVPMPLSSVRSYDVWVLAAFFSDGSAYFAPEQKWESIPESPQLRTRLFDRELIKQYKLETTAKSEFVPFEYKDLWVCSCGEINHRGESCRICSQQLGDLLYTLNVDRLLEEKNLRLMEEAKRTAARDSKLETGWRIVRIVLAVVIPLIIAAGVYFHFQNKAAERENNYQMARLMFEQGDYSAAAAAFDALEDYENSAQMAEEARAIQSEINAYELAKKFLENGRWEDARSAFLAMGDYEDAPQLADEALYRSAHELLEEGKCKEAQEVFLQLGDYSDSAQIAEGFALMRTSEDTSYDEECQGPLTTVYKYDSAGRIIEKTAFYSVYPGLNDRVLVYEYNEDGSYSQTEGSTLRQFDPYGNLVSVDGAAKYKYEYGYHDDGTLRYWDAYDPESGGFVCETVYDEEGNRIQYTDTEGNVHTTVNEYEGGLLVRQENFDPEGAFVDRTSFEYHEDGRLKRMTFMDLEEHTAVTNYGYELLYVPDMAK